jgi:hypothetical protein
LPSTGWREPYDGRLSRTVLREPEGATPPGHSPDTVEHVGSDDRFATWLLHKAPAGSLEPF